MLGPLPGAKGTVIREIWSLLSKTFSLMGKKPEKWCAQEMMGVCRRCHGNTEGLYLDQRANPVLMSISFTSKILQWKI